MEVVFKILFWKGWLNQWIKKLFVGLSNSVDTYTVFDFSMFQSCIKEVFDINLVMSNGWALLIQLHVNLLGYPTGIICGKGKEVAWWMEPLREFQRILNKLPIQGEDWRFPKGFQSANPRPDQRPDKRPKNWGAAGPKGFWPLV